MGAPPAPAVHKCCSCLTWLLCTLLQKKTQYLLKKEACAGALEGSFIKMLTQLTGAKTVLEVGMFAGTTTLAVAAALPQDGKVCCCVCCSQLGFPLCSADPATVCCHSQCDISAEQICTGQLQQSMIGDWMQRAKLLGLMLQVYALELEAYLKEYSEPSFKESGLNDRIDVLVGPAGDSIESLAKQGINFDIAFLDADKTGYLGYYKQLMDLSLIVPGGIIVVDNALMKVSACSLDGLLAELRSCIRSCTMNGSSLLGLCCSAFSRSCLRAPLSSFQWKLLSCMRMVGQVCLSHLITPGKKLGSPRCVGCLSDSTHHCRACKLPPQL